VTAAHRESALFRIGVALIALYILDDNFLQPEPGMSASDHLISGTVPLLVAVAAAVIYPRLRPGGRAVLALSFGGIALGAGLAVPVYHSIIDGPAGDDFTGILATLAGLLLVAVGTTTLWRSRRGGSRTRRYTRRLLIGVVGAVGAFELVAPIAFGFAFTRKARSPCPPSSWDATMKRSASAPATASTSRAGTSARETAPLSSRSPVAQDRSTTHGC
jgi:hypothetical protein